MSQIFIKTAKGQEEIKTRAGGITQRMRQILIFVDGKRSRDDLFGMIRGDDFDQQLKALIDGAYISVSGESASTVKPAAAPQGSASQPAAATVKTSAPAPAAKTIAPSQAEIEERNRKRKQEEEEHEDIDAARSFMSKM